MNLDNFVLFASVCIIVLLLAIASCIVDHLDPDKNNKK
jgi:hypothetical protein